MESRPSTAPTRRLRMRRATLASYGILLLAMIAGCGPGPKEDTDLIRKVGVVILSQADGTAQPEGQAAFVELADARARNLMASALSASVGTCMVGTPGNPASGSLVEAPSGARLSVANAVFTVDGRPYGQLQPTESGSYQLTGTTGPLPGAGLALTLPASTTFGGVESLSIPTGTAPLLAPGFDASAIRSDTEFRWQPGSSAATVLLMGSGAGVTFFCVAEDAAGTFAFPQTTRADLAEASFTTGQLAVVGRLTTTSAPVGDSNLLLIGALRLSNLGVDR